MTKALVTPYWQMDCQLGRPLMWEMKTALPEQMEKQL